MELKEELKAYQDWFEKTKKNIRFVWYFFLIAGMIIFGILFFIEGSISSLRVFDIYLLVFLAFSIACVIDMGNALKGEGNKSSLRREEKLDEIVNLLKDIKWRVNDEH